MRQRSQEGGGTVKGSMVARASHYELSPWCKFCKYKPAWEWSEELKAAEECKGPSFLLELALLTR
jgi:hypothetical protein